MEADAPDPKPFEDFVSVLRQAGFHCDPESVADALWFAGWQPFTPTTDRADPKVAEREPGGGERGDAQREGLRKSMEPGDEREDGDSTQAETPSETPKRAALYAAGSDPIGTGRRASPFYVPAASALPGTLEIARALRPFYRRWPSSWRRTVDEEATADYYAQFGFIRPVLLPLPERWFDVALVVDAALSMDVWTKTLDEFENLLALHGAFGRVRRFRLIASVDKVELESRAGQRIPPSALSDPRGRTVVLVATNGVADYWDGNAIAQAFQEWARRAPVAILQLFPERNWPYTRLGPATRAVRAPLPGSTSAKLEVQSARPERAPGDIVAVPMMSLAPESMARWAQCVMAMGIGSAPAAVFVPGAAEDDEPTSGGAARLDARERVERFASIASSEGFRLAAYLAAVPVTLPIMRIVEDQTAHPPRVEHLAEALASGLLERITPADAAVDPEAVVYDYPEDVREVLLSALGMGSAFEIRARVETKLKEFVERQIGRTIENFRAFVLDDSGEFELPESARAFVEIERGLLDRFGPARTGGKPRDGAGELAGPAPVEESPLVALVEARGYRALLDRVRQMPDASPDYWQLLTTVRASGESWADFFARAGENRVPRAGHEPRGWHEAMALVAAELNDDRPADIAQRFERLLVEHPDLRRTLNGRSAGAVGRVAWYRLFLLEPSLERGAEIVATVGTEDETGNARAFAQSLRCVLWIARHTQDDNVIANCRTISQLLSLALKQAPEEFETCRTLMRERIEPWIKLAELASEYVMTRRSMSASQERTAAMTRVVRRMQEYGDAVESGDLGDLLRHKHPGRRLIACAALAKGAETDQLTTVVRCVAEEPQPFVQYWGLSALWRMVQDGAVLADGERERLERMRARVSGDRDRAELLDAVLAFRPGPLAGKRVLLQGEMYEALGAELRAAGATVETGLDLPPAEIDLIVARFPRDWDSYNNATTYIASLRSLGLKAPIVFHAPYMSRPPVASWTDNAVFFVDLSELRAAVIGWQWPYYRVGPANWVLVSGTGRASGLPEDVQIGAAMVGSAVAHAGMGLITGGWPGVDHIAAREFAAGVEQFGVPVELGLVHNIDLFPKPDFPKGRTQTFDPGGALTESLRSAAVVVLVGGEGGTWEVFRAALEEVKIVLPLASSGGDAARAWKLLRLAPGYAEIGSATAPLTDRNVALGQGRDGLVRDLRRLKPLRPGIGQFIAFLVIIVFPAVEEYWRPGSVAELEQKAGQIRDQLKQWSDVSPQVVPTLVTDVAPYWRVAGYLAFQAHPDIELVGTLMDSLPREIEYIQSAQETRPLFQWLGFVFACLGQASLRSRLPADLNPQLNSLLGILQSREDIDGGEECKNLIHSILEALPGAGPAFA